jgi:hypothetical protein
MVPKSTRLAEQAISIIALSLLFLALLPSAASALGVAGFDIHRPNAENPDGAFHFTLGAGETAEEQVVIKNTSDDTLQELRVYIAGGLAARNSGITLGSREAPKSGLAQWITLDSPEEISLEPGEERVVKLTLRVPEFAEPNEQIAGIVVERRQAVESQDDGQFKINVLPRAAILITQRIPGQATRDLSILELSQTWADKDPNKVFRLRVKNQGNVHLQPEGEIRIVDVLNREVGVLPLRMATVFPEEVKDTREIWKKPPLLGYFKAKATVTYTKDKSVSREIRFFIFPPWWMVAALIGILAVSERRRRLRAAEKLEQAAALEEMMGMATLEDALMEIEIEADESLRPPEPQRVAARTAAPKTRAKTATQASPGRARRPAKAPTGKTAAATPKPPAAAPPARAKKARPPEVAAAEIKPVEKPAKTKAAPAKAAAAKKTTATKKTAEAKAVKAPRKTAAKKAPAAKKKAAEADSLVTAKSAKTAKKATAAKKTGVVKKAATGPAKTTKKPSVAKKTVAAKETAETKAVKAPRKTAAKKAPAAKKTPKSPPAS